MSYEDVYGQERADFFFFRLPNAEARVLSRIHPLDVMIGRGSFPMGTGATRWIEGLEFKSPGRGISSVSLIDV